MLLDREAAPVVFICPAAVADGAGASFAETTAWVRSTLDDAGIDLTGVKLKDNCGLSSGQVVPARVISDVMQLGITGSAQTMSVVLSQLPVAGLTGTLHERYRTALKLPPLPPLVPELRAAQ